MATYIELRELHSDATLLAKVYIAVLKAVELVVTEDVGTANHANRLLWAKETLVNPVRMAKTMYPYILAANSSATVAQIQSASDASVQSNINSIIDVVATGV